MPTQTSGQPFDNQPAQGAQSTQGTQATGGAPSVGQPQPRGARGAEESGVFQALGTGAQYSQGAQYGQYQQGWQPAQNAQGTQGWQAQQAVQGWQPASTGQFAAAAPRGHFAQPGTAVAPSRAGNGGGNGGAGYPGGPGGPGSQHGGRKGGNGRPQKVVVLPRWAFLILIVALIALFASTVVLGIRGCTPEEETEPEEWVSPYDWDNLKLNDDGFYVYYKDGKVASEAGIDVSEHDGAIDWEKVAADGVQFVMIRLGYRGYGSAGTLVTDPYFFDNIKGAKAAGIKVGVYFFSQAISEAEAEEEAQYVIDQLEEAGVELDYPVAFDEEPITGDSTARTHGITNEQLTKNAIAFCKAIEKAGYTAMLYGNQYDLAKLDLTGELAKYDVWLAEYEVSTPTAQTDFVMWQYSEHGSVDGITTSEGWVDIDIRFLEE